MNMQPEEINALTQRVVRELEKPGSSTESVRRYLVEREGCSPSDARALAFAVCRNLMEERCPAITETELMLTEDCNQRCHYCFVEGKNEFNRMPWEVARRAVEFLIASSRDAKEVRILFFGGEPMLEFELIRKIIAYARKRGEKAGKRVRFDMTTNAALFDNEKAAFLARHEVKCLVSIDGDRDTHDRHRKSLDGKSSYEKVVKALPVIKKHQPWLGVRMTVHPDAVRRLEENVRHLAALGINQFLVGVATGQEWTDEELEAYREEMIKVARWLRQQLDRGRPVRVTTLEENLRMMGGRQNAWGCRAGRNSITVTARGEIYPCSKMLGVEGLRGIFPLGTLDSGITEIYHRLALCGMVPVERRTCAACSEADRCLGGCFATNYQATGSLFEPDPFDCRMKRTTIRIVAEAEKILGAEYYEKVRSKK